MRRFISSRKDKTVDQLPLERLIGPGACVDVSQKCAADRDYQVTVEDFQKWEADNKASLENRIVLDSHRFRPLLARS